jgi:anaerobic selenocysteine-containing dehydrogenase
MAALPVKVLYDQEPLFVLGAPVLRERLAQPVVDLSPADAQRLKVETGDMVEISFDGRAVQAMARVNDGVADGVAVMPFRAARQGSPRSAVSAQIVKLERVGA